MKLFIVVSDSHGDIKSLNKVVNEYPMAHSIIHLGDYLKDGFYLKAQYPEKVVYSVPGNCDFLREGHTNDLILEEEGVRILLTHGHRYDVKSGLIKLKHKALTDKINVALFGHTHSAFMEKTTQCLILNPGSTAYPRGFDIPTYALLEIGNGRAEARIMEVS